MLFESRTFSGARLTSGTRLPLRCLHNYVFETHGCALALTLWHDSCHNPELILSVDQFTTFGHPDQWLTHEADIPSLCGLYKQLTQ